jgi:hypothetical protein
VETHIFQGDVFEVLKKRTQWSACEGAQVFRVIVFEFCRFWAIIRLLGKDETFRPGGLV